MSKLVEINYHPDYKTLRNFGFVAFVGFGLLAGMAWTESFLFTLGLGGLRSNVTLTFVLLALSCFLFGLIYPPANKPIYIGLSLITLPIGIVLSYVIMSVLFFGLIGLVALIMRVLRYDPMNRKLESDSESYWSDARPARPKSDYFKQY